MSVKPYGHINWVYTNMCVSIHCECGKVSHYDGNFMHGIQCSYCKRIYHASPRIQLAKVEVEYANPSLEIASK